MICKRWIIAGAVLAAAAVATGAFGAHGLKDQLDTSQLANFETAVRYQMFHALAMIGLGLLPTRSSTTRNIAGSLFMLGMLLFCGCLYGVTLSGVRWLAFPIPIGGVAFMVGWLGFAVAAANAGAVPPDNADTSG